MSFSTPASAEARNGILVIGDAQVGKRFIVRRISAPRNEAAAVAAAAAASALPAAAAVRPQSRIEDFHIQVDTKYYSAQLTFHVLPADAHAQLSGEEPLAATGGSDPAVIPPLTAEAHAEFAQLDVQAVLLVFDLSNAASFHAVVARWLPFIQTRNPSVLLLVGNETRNAAEAAAAKQLTPAQLQEREELEQLARDWALDNGLEYVSVPHNDALGSARPSLATASAAADADDDELDAAAEPAGVSRLLEALESNMWSHARMKDRSNMQYMRGGSSAANGRGADSAHHGLDDEDEEDMAADAEEEESKEDAGESAFAEMAAQMKREDAAAAAAAAAAAGSTAVAAASPDDESFTGFVSATSGAASQPATTSAAPAATVAVAGKAKPSPAARNGAAVRSASASAFANAFARAISSDDEPSSNKPATATAASTKAKPKTAAVAPASSLTTTASSASTNGGAGAGAGAPIDAPISAEELAELEEHLTRAQRDAAASTEPAATEAEEAERKLEKDVQSFDALFDKIKDIKCEAMAARAAAANSANSSSAASISDEERRRRAEDTVMRLLQSMGLQDELDFSDDEA